MRIRAVLPPLLAMALLAALAGAVAAAEEEAARALRFRRIFVPAERLSDWPTGSEKYLPLDAAEFERLAAAVPSHGAAASSLPAAAITSARYEAKLVGDHLAGQATLDVVLAGPPPALLPLEPCNVALGPVTWDAEQPRRGKNPPDQAAGAAVAGGPDAQSPAGATVGVGGDGRLAAKVDRSGQLRFDWSLAGHRYPADVLGFVLEIPRAPASELWLELPKDLTPAADRGLLVASEPAGPAARRWHIELGGRRWLRLRILPAGMASHRPQLALLRESRTYDFSLRGVDVSAQWRIQVLNEPLQQVNVVLDAGLQLISARLGDVSIPWSVAPPESGRPTRVTLTLPEPIRDAERVLRLNALGPLVVGQPWRLPRLRADGLFWQEGNISLLMSEPLVAERIAPQHCVQTAAGVLAAPRTGESLQFQPFEAEATVELSLARRTPTLHVLSATAVELGGDEVTARIAADFRASGAERFALEADVTRPWIVEAVESVPVGAVADWTLDPQAGRAQRLAIRLGQGISPAKPLRLVITARRSFSPVLQKLGVDHLAPLRIRNATDEKRLVAVRAAEPYALKLSGADHLERLAAENLSPTDLSLFAAPPKDLLFECDGRAAALRVSLIAREAKLSGTIHVDAAVGDGTLRETCLLRCVPQAAHLDRVLVQFYPRRPTAPQWTVAGDEVSPRKWSDREQTKAGWDTSLETWELTLRHPKRTPFEITAVRQIAAAEATSASAGGGPMVLTLASLPEATSQTGSLVVRNVGPQAIRMDNRRLKPIPPEVLPAARAQAVAGAFRYDPARQVAQGATAALRVSTPEKPDPWQAFPWGAIRDRRKQTSDPDAWQAWVWDCQLQSWYQVDGTIRHQAALDLHNAVRRGLTFALLVAREDVRSVSVDGDPVAWRWATCNGAGLLGVDLPMSRKSPRVVIEWTARGRSLGIAGSLVPPSVELDVPVLACSWTAWLPPGYDSVDASAPGATPACAGLNWSCRLFGLFGRAAGSRRFDPLSLSDWTTSLAWAASDSTPAQAGLQGWTAWRTELNAAALPRLAFVHRDSMRLLGTIVFLLVAAAGCWKAAARPAWFVLALGIFAAAALLLADAYAPIASGGVLGALFCLVWRWMRTPREPPAAELTTAKAPAAKSPPGSTVSRTVQLGIFALTVLPALLLGRAAKGATPPAPADDAAEKQAAAPPLYRVLTPVDENKTPTGGKVYVSEPLYQELYRRAAAAGNSPGWLIQAAAYRGVLAESVSGRLAVDVLRAQYDLHTFGRATRVRIPFRAEGVIVLPNGVSLDGRAIQPQWEQNGAALAFDVAEPGQYRLEILLRPTIRNTVGPAGFDFPVPRVASSRLELTLPQRGLPIEVPSACGAVRVEKEPPRLSADLGPAERLTVRWQEGAASPGAGLNAEQLVWLKLQPGSLVITNKFRLHPGEGQIQQVQLAVDPQLRLLPLPGEDPPTVQMGPESEQARLLAFRWSHPVAEPVTLEATFLLSGATGVGNFRLPRIELLEARTAKRWMAVSIDPALEREKPHKEPLKTVPVADFLKAWGAAEGKPLAAYLLPAGESDWTISTRPREPRSTSDQIATLTYDEDHLEVLFEAQVTTTSGYLFQHVLRAPAGLKIEEVSLLEDDVERAGRWAQAADGRVTVFLNDAASGSQRFLVRGRLPIQVGKAVPVPCLRLEQCQLHAATMRLCRQRGVLLTVQGSRQPPAAEPPVERPKSDAECFVEAFSGDGSSAPPVTVTVTPNRPKVRVQEVVTAQWNGRSWTARLDSHLSIRGGVVDQIEIHAPQPWNGPYQANLPGQLQARQSPGQLRRLVFRSQVPLFGDVLLSISGPLELARGERPSVPDIHLLGIERTERWFVLPGRTQGQTCRWQTRGLTPAARPPLLIVSAEAAPTSYKVSGQPVQAVLEPADMPRGSSVVRLADVTMVWRADGNGYGAAVFDLEPGGAGECPLSLPKGYELVQVSVDGLAVTPRSVDTERWRFPLASRQLPQRVEVLFRGRPAATERANRRNFEAPVLGNLPVRQTLWTVIGPSLSAEGEPDSAPVVSPWKQDLSRLRSAAAAFESACTVQSDDPEETLRTYQLWNQRVEAARTAVTRALAACATGSASATSGAERETAAAQRESEAIETQRAELVKRVARATGLAGARATALASAAPNSGEMLRRASAGAKCATGFAGASATGSASATPVVRCAFEGRAESVLLDSRSAEGSGFFVRLLAAVVLALLACAAAAGAIPGRVTAIVRHWPHAAGMLLGVVWWLWLWPSVIGLAIVLGCAIAAGRARMRAKTGAV